MSLSDCNFPTSDIVDDSVKDLNDRFSERFRGSVRHALGLYFTDAQLKELRDTAHTIKLP